ncbi:MAG: carbonic anhydrase [Syntrophobacteraceae bacterium]
MRNKSDFSADEAIQSLIDGNEPFLRGKAHLPGLMPKTLVELARGQHPFATILGCSDSRVPPEWIFDAGLPELFVVRLAGNVLSPEVAGSLLGVHLQTPLIVVLGHEGCGAIQAALERKHQDVLQHSRIRLLVTTSCRPWPDWTPYLPSSAQLAKPVEMNVRSTVRTIIESPEGQARVAEGRMKCIGAIYEIETRRVRLLEVLGQAAHTPGSPKR